MIFNPTEQLGASPVTNVAPIKPLVALAETVQDMDFRALQLVKGQQYYGEVLSRISGTDFQVRLQGASIRMNLGPQASVGQTLLLKYISDTPIPTFTLLPQEGSLQDSLVNLSRTAHLIDQQLRDVEAHGPVAKFEAPGILTQSPKHPERIAQDLNTALTNSGLFYESHLADLVEGHHSLSAVIQEPQNQKPMAAMGLLPQQLSILENHQLSWQGQVWAGQMMEWDIRLRNQDQSSSDSHQQSSSRDGPALLVDSQITLHLPKLGKVSARLSILGDRMRIKILAEEAATISTLKAQSKNLLDAMERNGQTLETFSVIRDDQSYV